MAAGDYEGELWRFPREVDAAEEIVCVEIGKGGGS